MWNKKLHLPRLFIFKNDEEKKRSKRETEKKKDTGPVHGKIKNCNFKNAITFNLKKIETNGFHQKLYFLILYHNGLV